MAQFLFLGGYTQGFYAHDITLYSAGIEAGASFLYGLTGPIPAPSGGHFPALLAEAAVSLNGGVIVARPSQAVLDAHDNTNRVWHAGDVLVRGMARIGFEYDHFGTSSGQPTRPRQRGVGVHLLYGVGAQYEWYDGDLYGKYFDLVHGPTLGLTLPKYANLRADISRTLLRVSLYHVPNGNLLYLAFSVGKAF